MVEPIVLRETIRDLARAAANCGQDVQVANPYPAGTVAHECFVFDFTARLLERERDAVSV